MSSVEADLQGVLVHFSEYKLSGDSSESIMPSAVFIPSPVLSWCILMLPEKKI